MSKEVKRIYKKLLDGTLSQEERQKMFIDLKSEKSQLLQFINNRDLNRVENELRKAFGNALPLKSRIESPSEEEVEATFDKILSQISLSEKRPKGSNHIRRHRVELFGWLGLSFAAGAVCTLLAIILYPDTLRETMLKGEQKILQTPVRIRLMFNVGRREPGRPIVVERGVPGGQYTDKHDVLLRYQLKRPGYVCLVHRNPSGTLEALNSGTHTIQAGWHDFKKGDKVQAFSLSGLHGTNTFYGLYSQTPLQCPEDLGSIIQGTHIGDIVVDSFFIEVQK